MSKNAWLRKKLKFSLQKNLPELNDCKKTIKQGLILFFLLCGISTFSADIRFMSNGMIKRGDKSLKLGSSGVINVILNGSDMLVINQQMSYGEVRWTYPPRFTDKHFKVDVDRKSAVFTAGMPEKKSSENLKYTLSTTLENNGKILIESFWKAPESVKTKYDIVFINIPYALISGKNIYVDGKRIKVEAQKKDGFILKYSHKVRKIEFFKDEPSASFSIYPRRFSTFYIKEKVAGGVKTIIVAMVPKKGRMSFQLEFLSGKSSAAVPASGDKYADMDFWKMDKLHMPQYSKCQNLIQNPSFENGMLYYQYRLYTSIPKVKADWYYKVDGSTAKFGCRSLAVNAVRNPAPIGTFAIPVEANQDYTFSFYARADKPKALLRLQGLTAKHPKFAKLDGNKTYQTFKLGTSWKRYSVRLKNPNTGLALFFQGIYHGKDKNCKMNIDGLQLEKGTKATAFKQKPVSAELVSVAKGNYLNHTDSRKAGLNIYTPAAGTSGKVKLCIQDFFYNEIPLGTYNFKTDDKGQAGIDLTLPKNKKGIFVLRSDFDLSDGRKYTGFYRFSIMEFLDNKQKNKNIFGILAQFMAFQVPEYNEFIARLKYSGIGSANYGVMSEDTYKCMKRHGFDYLGGEYLMVKRKKNGVIAAGDKELTGINSYSHIDDKKAKDLENIIAAKVKYYPYIPVWFFAGECGTGPMTRMLKDMGNFGKALKITYKTVKKVDPSKKVILTGGPCNMRPQSGTRRLKQYIDVTKDEVKFDAVAIHPYRAMPEHPDIDSDTSCLLKMLDENGYGDVPVYWNECMHYAPYHNPVWGINAYRGNSVDHYYGGPLSYHMGWAERIAAAFSARTWLVALKYADRVKMCNGWQHRWTFMDFNQTPYAIQKATNTLGTLLGNADFKKDIRFAPDTRCYIFEDEKKRPIAALWSCSTLVDMNKEKPPVVQVALDGKTEFIDMMENPFTPEKDKNGLYSFKLTPFPMFIRGKKGTLDSMCSVLSGMKLAGKSFCPVRVASKPLSSDQVQITVNNLLTRPFKGNVQINGKVQKLDIAPLGSKKFNIKLKSVAGSSRISMIDIPCLVTDRKGKKYNMPVAFEMFTIKKLSEGAKIQSNGSGIDWKSVPSIKLTNKVIGKNKFGNSREKTGYKGDLEASFKAAWDDDNLYLRVEVTDDKLVCKKNFIPAKRWNSDCVQLYIDTLCDARSKVIKGFDTNDYNYDFLPDPDSGKITTYRRVAPEQQIAGGLYAPRPNMVEPGIGGSFRHTKKGYIYEVVIPKKYIAPVALEAGTIIGFGLYVPDRDNDKSNSSKSCIKQALTTTPEGTGCYMNPHLYPVMMLER